jgi:three-Cys-motif partner protein
LKAWFPILGKYHKRILYIDGFAGPGIYSKGEKGSPLIALDIARNHIIKMESEIVFIFIEADNERCNKLKDILNEKDIPKNFKTSIYCDKFDSKLTEMLAEVEEQAIKIAPAFVFIDPFGYSQTPFSMVKKIMQNERCEVLITFVYDYINRFIGEQDRQEAFDKLFGIPDWRKVHEIANPDQRKQFLHDLYLSQLKNVAKVKYVRSFEMINTFGHTEYFLFFGTNHIEGLKQMKAAMWKVDETGEYQFSDRTDPHQTVLFKREPDYSQLRNIILKKFKGKTVGIDDLEHYILAETGFRETHYKRSILIPMENSSPPELEVFNRQKIRTYPVGCKIKFL